MFYITGEGAFKEGNLEHFELIILWTVLQKSSSAVSQTSDCIYKWYKIFSKHLCTWKVVHVPSTIP